ncbi:hypothetical protein [Pseudoxanthomonas indica]|uniref:Uncharacterized protein n=1 Tax=Pseudoxanthomonas indica TaxID=428993 RepID=A0A1T5LW99_9GAMM|nr:hypothetical protein [Pseudoxanthomonas indica]GGD40717.1 hypothetical protein GCM10007235_10950 [Pseudoxanthomonas indica]SKC80153.1 hypothetical protein SAMN06296058_3225 [Pseudoxanthomonas indica]
MREQTQIPVDVFNANMQRLGRSFNDAVSTQQGWQGEEYGLHCTWPDGFRAFVGFGEEASAIVEGLGQMRH